MPELILHQYELSPFSEKIRKILARKNLSWRSVEQPVVAPKPKLTPLTGGYRRIPVLQIGADVYCDTALIARVLEDLAPEPTIHPGGHSGVSEIVAQWADHWLFGAAVPPAIVKLLPVLPKEFIEDRARMSPGFSREALEAGLPQARSRLVAGLDWLERQLTNREFLLGDAFGLADAACFHVLWFLRNDPDAFEAVRRREPVRKWFDRVEAMGHGDGRPMDPDEALAIAREGRPETVESNDGTDPNGIRPGQPVTIRADDYGTEPISGITVVVRSDRIALRREDPEIGEVIVHFPRSGFVVQKA